MLENFETLTLGELQGQSGPSGISGSWQSQTSASEVTAAPANFEVTLPTGEVITSGNQSLQVTGNNNNTISATLATPLTEDFYFSFLVQMEAGSIGNNDFATFWFGAPTHIGTPAIGLKTGVGPGGTDLMGRITGNQEAYSNEQLGIGVTYYLVAKISKTNGSPTYNQVDFWVNPGSNEENTPHASSTGNISYSSFDSFGIRSVNLSPDDIISFDNPTLATEYSDLFPPIPEPTAPAFLLLALTRLLLSRKTR